MQNSYAIYTFTIAEFMLIFLALLPFLSHCSGHSESISYGSSYCIFNSSFLFCPADNSLSVCYHCQGDQPICNMLPDFILLCKEDHIYLLDNYCIIYEPNKGKIFVGHCPYRNLQRALIDTIYKKVPLNISELRCADSLKRSGIFCGECETNYYPLAYSYNLTCVSCTEGHINILKVLVALFVPLTVFCVVVVVFKINVFSSHLHGFVFYGQAVSTPAFVRVIFNGPFSQQPGYAIFIKSLLSFYSVWNLDILRSFSSGICLQVKARDILWFDLAIGTYPLVVLAVTYFIIQLCNYDITFSAILCKYIQKVLSKPWNISSSLIDAFATFMVLSNVKIMTSSMDLLTSTYVYELSHKNHTNNHWRLYYDPTVQLYHGHYSVNFCLCMLVMLVFVIIPFFVLLIYPTHCFQKCLNLTSWNWNPLHIFMDAFQGSFKNGTQPGERDFRWFSAVFFGGHITLALLHTVTFTSMYFVLSAIVVLIVVLLIIILEPFRPAVNNYSYSTTMFLLLLSLFYVILSGFDVASARSPSYVISFYSAVMVVSLIPIISFCFLVLQRIHKSFKTGGCTRQILNGNSYCGDKTLEINK